MEKKKDTTSATYLHKDNAAHVLDKKYGILTTESTKIVQLFWPNRAASPHKTLKSENIYVLKKGVYHTKR